MQWKHLKISSLLDMWWRKRPKDLFSLPFIVANIEQKQLKGGCFMVSDDLVHGGIAPWIGWKIMLRIWGGGGGSSSHCIQEAEKKTQDEPGTGYPQGLAPWSSTWSLTEFVIRGILVTDSMTNSWVRCLHFAPAPGPLSELADWTKRSAFCSKSLSLETWLDGQAAEMMYYQTEVSCQPCWYIIL